MQRGPLPHRTQKGAGQTRPRGSPIGLPRGLGRGHWPEQCTTEWTEWTEQMELTAPGGPLPRNPLPHHRCGFGFMATDKRW